MRESGEFRELLAADVALLLGVAEARDVAAALQRYWDRRRESGVTFEAELRHIAHLPDSALLRVRAEVERLLSEVAGDARAALSRRGGLDRSIHLALGEDGAGLTSALSVLGVPVRAPLRSLPPDRYAAFEVAGRGGMGVVYAALDTEMNRRVAFKMVRTDVGPSEEQPPSHPLEARRPAGDSPGAEQFEQMEARLVQEAWVTGGLEHPGIVPVHEIGQTASGIPYYTMRFVRGERTLAAAIREKSAAPVEQRLALLEPFLRVCDAVHYAHDRGVVHRDLKPDNVALGDYGEVVVLDWGLARLEGREDAAASAWQRQVEDLREAAGFQTLEGAAVGTAGYMAPEAARGRVSEVDRRSDVYSLGAILYEILTGRVPYAFRTLAEYVARQSETDPPPASEADPAVPADLSALCGRALARAPADRPDSAQALASAVRAWQARDAADREAEALLRDARAAVTSAEGLQGEARRVQADRAVAALAQAEARRPGHGDAARLRTRAEALREEGVRQRERAAARRSLRRAGAAAAVLLALAGVVVGAVLEQRRRELAAERDGKARALSDVLRLADSKRVRDLLQEAAALWPLLPSRADAMAAWLGRARDAAAHRVRHRERLAELGSAAPSAAAEPELAWQHQVLTDLLADLDRLEGPDGRGGLVAQVGRRHEFVTTLRRRSVDDHAGDWRTTIEGVAASPRYGGLRIVPQVGLVPLGPDPDSGLFEFAHLGSGSVPARDPETRRLAVPEDAAIVLVLMPGGTFRMGAQNEGPAAPNHDPQATPGEAPVHEVTLPAHFLGKHEVTQGQWAAMTGLPNPSQLPAGSTIDGKPITMRHPVEQVSWAEVTLWLGRHGLALPTEAQWERGCRGGTDTPWWTGRDPSLLGRAANVADAGLKRRGGWVGSVSPEVDDGHALHAPVGSLAPNAYGLHDVHGNVWEWCADEFGLYPREARTGPAPDGPGLRPARGGAWNGIASLARSASRLPLDGRTRQAWIGVRAARALAPE